MTSDEIKALVRGLEVQLLVLKAQMKRSGLTDGPSVFSDLRGALQGAATSSNEDIESAQYDVKWPKDEPECGGADQ